MTAAEFVAALRARGVALVVKDNRLRLVPWASFGGLSADERAALKTHRAEIKSIVANTPTAHEVGARDTPPEPPVQTAGPEPDDPDAELKKHNLAAWRVIHGNEREEIERRNRDATAVMYRMVRPF